MVEDYSELLDKEDVTEVEVETVVEAEAVAEEVKAEEAETETETVETEVEVKPEETAALTTDAAIERGTLSGMMDEREKRQKAVAEADELRQKLKAYEQPEDEISVFEDEQGFKKQQQHATQAALRNSELNMSQAFAEKEFGEEKVAAVADWFKKDGVQSPAALKRFNEAKLPFHELVSMYDDDLIMRDPAAYKAELLAELRSELETETKKPNTPSLTKARSVGAASFTTEDAEDILNE